MADTCASGADPAIPPTRAITPNKDTLIMRKFALATAAILLASTAARRKSFAPITVAARETGGKSSRWRCQ